MTTATPRMTENKKNNGDFFSLNLELLRKYSCFKSYSHQYVTPAIRTMQIKLVAVAHFIKIPRTWPLQSRCCFAEDDYEMYIDL